MVNTKLGLNQITSLIFPVADALFLPAEQWAQHRSRSVWMTVVMMGPAPMMTAQPYLC